jgi:hypothetical protein
LTASGTNKHWREKKKWATGFVLRPCPQLYGEILLWNMESIRRTDKQVNEILMPNLFE